MKPKFIIGMIVGILILYLGLFNLQGFGFRTLDLSSTPYREDFKLWPENNWSPYSGSGTSGTISINPAGELQLSVPPSSSASDNRVSAMSGDFGPTQQYTVRERILLDSCAGGAYEGIGWYESSCWFPLSLNNGSSGLYLSYQQGTYSVPLSNLQNTWHVWTFLVDHTTGSPTSYGTLTGTLKAYEDSSLVGTWTGIGAVQRGSAGFSYDCAGGNSASSGTTLCHFDYAYVDNGLNPPGGGGTQYGSIQAYCTLDGSPEAGVTVTATPGTGLVTSSSSSGYATIANVAFGTYTVTAALSGYTAQSHSGILVDFTSGPANAGTFAFTSSVSQTGTIYVDATDSAGNAIRNTACLITVQGVASADAPHTFQSVAYGTYTVSATWKGEYESTSVTVSSGNPNPSATLHFTQNVDSTSGGTGGANFVIEKIRSFIAAETVPISLLGLVITVISSILFILPTKYKIPITLPKMPSPASPT